MDSIKTRRRRGRPASGKKGFMVRMPPDAHEAIKQIAERNGLAVGDWLAQLHLFDYSPRGTPESISSISISGLEGERHRLVLLAAETSRLFEMLFEVVDVDHRIADDETVVRALSTLEAKRKRLLALLKRECPGSYRDFDRL